jgi:hypothetical protein
VGFGIVRPCPTKGAWPSEFWVAKTKQIAAPKDRSVRVVSDLEVPVRGLLLLVICFAVGIGPVNVWLLSRRQKKMWLWWNVPAVSLATCLAVFGYSVASEGISGRGRSALMTLLDENSHRATTLGYISYYCPLTPSDGLHFSYDTEVSALVPDSGVGYPMYRSGRGKSVDWTSDQHFTSGWVVARVPAFFSVRKSEVRRERLAFRRGDDGTLRVVNGLGADIESLNYVDPQGNAYTASSIPAGQERALVAKPASATPNSSTSWSERGLFKQSWETSLVELQKQPERYLKPGRYVAVVGRSPFLENPLESASQDGSFGIIYGISSGAGDGR